MDMQGLYAQMFERGLSARTIEYTNAVLESAFRQAVRWRMLAEDPCAGVDLPRVKRKEMEALSVEECRRFLAVAEESEWYALFALALTTGMRPSEYLALKWSDIDWQRGAASVSRTIQVSGSAWAFDDTKRKRSRRVVKLQSFVLAALESLREKQASGRGRELLPRERPDLRDRKRNAAQAESGEAGISPVAGEGRDPVGAALRSAPYRGHTGNRSRSLGEGDL